MALGFLTTLTVTVSGEVNTSARTGASEESSVITGDLNVTNASDSLSDGGQSAASYAAAAFAGMSSTQRGFYLVAIVLPALMSIVSSLRQDLNYSPKIVALRHAAAEVLSETYRYRASAGVYGDLALAKDDIAACDGEAGDGGGDRKVGWGCDTISARAEILTKKLVEVSARLDSFDRPNFDEMTWFWWLLHPCVACWTYVKTKCPFGKFGRVHAERSATLAGNEGALRVKVAGRERDKNGVQELVRDLNLKGKTAERFKKLMAECESERQYGVLSGDDYATERLAPEMARCEAEADVMERWYLAYRIAAYVLGALGSILSLLHFEVRTRDLLRSDLSEIRPRMLRALAG